eukprot:623441-Amphidinium_carterae.1
MSTRSTPLGKSGVDASELRWRKHTLTIEDFDGHDGHVVHHPRCLSNPCPLLPATLGQSFALYNCLLCWVWHVLQSWRAVAGICASVRLCVCASARLRVCAPARLRACVRACLRACVRASVRPCVRAC